MNRLLRALLPAALLGVLAFAVPAAANHGEPESSPNMRHVANVDKEGTNSDLAFWENIVGAGHFGGFRLIDITKPEKPKLLVDFTCNGGQSDPSFYKAKNRLLLFQSVDRAQARNPLNPTNPCASINSTAADPTSFEGIRIFDITDPKNPFLVREVYTDCGSHTHTTIPDPENQRAVIYVSSYPLSPFDLGPNCQQPHKKISIVLVPDDAPEQATVKEHPLHEDTQIFGDGIQACHEIEAFTDPKVMVAAGSCLSEGQLWDITDPANPCTVDPSCHTHVDNALVEIWHSAAFTWDARVVLFWDEHGGGMAHGCNGPADTTGNIWFYKNVPPGTPTVPLYGRYQIPRPEPLEEVCTLHMGSIIPVNDNEAYVGVSSAYEGGTTLFDFTPLKTVDSPLPILDPLFAPIVAEEIAYWDNEANSDGKGWDDVWASYWYNDYIYASSGLGARQVPPRNSNRGLDVYRLLQDDLEHKFTARKFHHFNPQTQENFETLGG
jgi:hypothetical protein